jgi:hypothetical protein
VLVFVLPTGKLLLTAHLAAGRHLSDAWASDHIEGHILVNRTVAGAHVQYLLPGGLDDFHSVVDLGNLRQYTSLQRFKRNLSEGSKVPFKGQDPAPDRHQRLTLCKDDDIFSLQCTSRFEKDILYNEETTPV